MVSWRTAIVPPDYHIRVERMFYSVPFEYIKDTIDIRITQNIIEFFYKDTRIASHKRLYGQFGQFATDLDHLPDNHRQYAQNNPAAVRE